ncbi:Sec-independent protein translocase protein TatB [Pelagibacterium halotolerans]|uniref:Sec-independent protein translocase protein TatB n=1 Tax=Pelagibacterium halotolerans (strain DSM 22347 / JCM 15775 / CGMCC 1.7692 / B2) TaxID=1082931 RepID=G4R9U1_PELHB|nr:Sec-independent protein translocase protein TatB [Pelagibacterium halotolerans]AEQ51495.1 Twin-arginine translocation protein TatB [Pelagibacterium halotolerans B2]QJR18666.1 twin-arginine translocase subunit TatB [Pelagibacterium halotolerans]SEA15123.1 sec-independent protein translocase protein TatB [Pelagibacterium halotolerans]
MLGLGWSEMLVIGIVLLVVVGPKDLPMMMRNVGRMMGTVRRMGNDFRREIDKAIAADEIAEAKKAISDPLRQTSAEINREFNSIRNGKVEPTGKLKPPATGEESVVDAIHAQAGMSQARATPSAASAALRAKVSESVARPADAATTAAEQPAPLADAPAKTKVKAAPRKAATPAAKATDKGGKAATKAAKPAAATKPAAAKAAPKPAATPSTKKTADEKPVRQPKAASKAGAKKTTARKTTPTPKKAAADTGGDK